MRHFFGAILLLFFFGNVSFRNSNNPELKPAKILGVMYDSIKNIKTLRQKISALERIDKQFNSAKSEIKLQTNPRKLYFINPTKKLEILYNPEIYGQKALVKPNTFPNITISLDPHGNLMRKNQHYTIQELGYDFIGKSIALTINKDKEALSNFTYHGKVLKNTYNCYFLEYENKSYAYTNYIVGEKESVSLIALKLNVNDYLLRQKNDLLNEFSFLKKGRVLKVPTLYCRRAIIFIDDRLMLPVSISLYDENGLFESYEYTNIEVNKAIQANEFKRDYHSYGF